MIDKIKANCKLVDEAIEETISIDDPTGCLEKLDKLIVISAMAVRNRANAKQHLRECVLVAIEGVMGTEYQQGLPASTLNSYIQAKCGEDNNKYVKSRI